MTKTLVAGKLWRGRVNGQYVSGTRLRPTPVKLVSKWDNYLAWGSDSPVRDELSTLNDFDSMIRKSAGTRSPNLTSTMSPRVSSSAFRVSFSPSRTQRAYWKEGGVNEKENRGKTIVRGHLNTVVLRKTDMSGFRMVDLGSIFKWSGYRMVYTSLNSFIYTNFIYIC